MMPRQLRTMHIPQQRNNAIRDAMLKQTKLDFYLKMKNLEMQAGFAAQDRRQRFWLFLAPFFATIAVGYFIWALRLKHLIRQESKDQGDDAFDKIMTQLDGLKIEKQEDSTGMIGSIRNFMASTWTTSISVLQVGFKGTYNLGHMYGFYIETLLAFTLIMIGISAGCFFLALGLIASNIKGIGVGPVRVAL